jgi:hypothetical protein
MKSEKVAWIVAILVLGFSVFNLALHVVWCWSSEVCVMWPAAAHVMLFSMQVCAFAYGIVCGLVLGCGVLCEKEECAVAPEVY